MEVIQGTSENMGPWLDFPRLPSDLPDLSELPVPSTPAGLRRDPSLPAMLEKTPSLGPLMHPNATITFVGTKRPVDDTQATLAVGVDAGVRRAKRQAIATITESADSHNVQQESRENSSSSSPIHSDAEEELKRVTDPEKLRQLKRVISNRKSAKRSRERQKEKVAELESQVASLQKDIKELTSANEQLENENQDLKTNDSSAKIILELKCTIARLEAENMRRGDEINFFREYLKREHPLAQQQKG